MQTIAEKVSVILEDNIPISITWKNRDYKITKIGLHHDYYEGKVLMHVFSVLSDSLFLKLKLNTKHLTWNLMEIDQT
ncbi:MAG: hypothetical protein Q8Q30_00985 [Candidatus Woesebacteria bacterium]|nr:hypothetical protein [Candidatus Woesebacteria bacterium]